MRSSHEEDEGMKNEHGISISVILLTVIALVVPGCFSAKRASDVKFSGFLGQDYDKLQKGGPDQALYNYIKPGVNWASYNKMLLEPVTVMVPADEKGIVSSDMLSVANNFYSQLVTELSKNWEMVKEPGPNTIRAKVGLTDVSPGSGAMQAVSSVLPIGLAVSGVQTMVGAKPSFSGELSVETKANDATTGELLGAGVDRRLAGKSLKTASDTWGALNNVTETWAKMFSYRLCKEKGATNCVSPVEKK
jgi:hypothetical protein